jgi:YesN/AraC family two-component response regulator
MREILLVDDEQHILNALRRELNGSSWSVTATSDPREAAAWLEMRSFDVVMSDFRMPKLNGVELLTRVHKLWPETVSIILSGYTDAEAMLKAVNEVELFRYALKPWNSKELLEMLDSAWRHHEELKLSQRLIAESNWRNDKALRREAEIQKFEKQEPGLTQVEFSPTGTIWLADEAH